MYFNALAVLFLHEVVPKGFTKSSHWAKDPNCCFSSDVLSKKEENCLVMHTYASLLTVCQSELLHVSIVMDVSPTIYDNE